MNLLKNNKGVTTLLMVGAVSTVASIIIAFGTVKLINTYSSKVYFLEDWQKAFVSEKAAAIGAYLVSNNLVWCRQEAWKSGKKCKWGGGSQKKKVKLYSYLDDDSDGEANLTYKLDIDVESFKVEDVVLSFDLVDLNSGTKLADDIKEKVNFKEKNTPEVFDKDHYVVLIRTKVPYKAGKDKVEQQVTDRVIRRPFAFVDLQVMSSSTSTCKAQCHASKENSDKKSADCLSALEAAENPRNATMMVKVINEGPGILYKLNISKSIDYSDVSVQGTEVAKSVVFKDDDEDAVLLPNNPVELSLDVPCPRPRMVRTVSSSQSNTNTSSQSSHTIDRRSGRGQDIVRREYSTNQSTRTTTTRRVSTSLHLERFATAAVAFLRERENEDNKKVSQFEPARMVRETDQTVPINQRVTVRNTHTHTNRNTHIHRHTTIILDRAN